MKIFDYSNKVVFETDRFPDACVNSDELFILCRTPEVPILRDVFGYDESTVLNCTDLDESIRYTSFDGYDFISIVHLEMSDDSFTLRELNLYASTKYLVLVMPPHNSPRIDAMENKLLHSARLMEERAERLNRLYFWIFHYLLADFSATLELLEDWMQALSEEIVISVEQTHFSRINTLRNMAYTAKKQLRSLSYLGEQMLMDENKIISKKQASHFRSIDTRLKKLYDFAENLYSFGGELLYTYDSRLTMKTNDTVNKLTTLTLFFGPLTVITGIYGMNFEFMPELGWQFGYPLAIAVMAAVCAAMYLVLKKKHWL